MARAAGACHGRAMKTLDSHLHVEVGEPDATGSLTVFPLFGSEPRLFYRAFTDASKLGVRISEVVNAASVTDLVVENPTDAPVLAYDGQEVLGARQNRTFDGTVLVPAHAKLTVPVNCVEQGRWDASRHTGSFAAAPQASPPGLRRARHETQQPGDAHRSYQRMVWSHVSALAEAMHVSSPTGALHDIYEAHRDRIEQTVQPLEPRPRQTGALVAIGLRFMVLDLLSRPDVYVALHPALRQGYALDALGRDAQDIRAALGATIRRPSQRRPHM
jgi:hypothetical protein